MAMFHLNSEAIDTDARMQEEPREQVSPGHGVGGRRKARHRNGMRRSAEFAILVGLIGVALMAGCAGTPSPTRPAVEHGAALSTDSWRASLPDVLRNDVEALANKLPGRHASRPKQLENAAVFIEQSLVGMGLRPQRERYDVTFREREVDVSNIVVEIVGTSDPETIILLGSHYDTEPQTPGADDNASGVAVLLALAEYFAHHHQPATIRLVFFTNEEQPFLHSEDMGSLVNAQRAQRAGESIAGAIVFDMVGYYSKQPVGAELEALADQHEIDVPPREDFLMVGAWPLADHLVGRVADAWNAELTLTQVVVPSWVGDLARSDQWSYWQVGYPAVLVTDTGHLRNPHYHRRTDRPGTLDYETMAAAADGLRWVAVDLASDPPANPIDPVDEIVLTNRGDGVVSVSVDRLKRGRDLFDLGAGETRRIHLARYQPLVVGETTVRCGARLEIEHRGSEILDVVSRGPDGDERRARLGASGRTAFERRRTIEFGEVQLRIED